MKPQNRCERVLNDWLTVNPDGRVLILVDEADAFFAADSRREFRVTSDLFALVTKHPRTKAVFAGLHGVAHHHGVGNNPFSPSGALPIGPLERRHAYRLLTVPLVLQPQPVIHEPALVVASAGAGLVSSAPA